MNLVYTMAVETSSKEFKFIRSNLYYSYNPYSRFPKRASSALFCFK